MNCTNTKAVHQVASAGLVSDQVSDIINIINAVILGDIIAVFGTISNVINIIVFVKQGFHDTVNISLTSLAVGDMGSLITYIWLAVCFNPWFLKADLPFLPVEIQRLTAGFPRIYFNRVTGCITAFVALERCLCVVTPLKIKTIVTRKLVITVNIIIYLVMTLGVFPIYYTSYFDWKLNPATNKTRLGIFYTRNSAEVMGVALIVNNFCVPIFVFIILIVSTATISVKLKRSVAWRKSTSTISSIHDGKISSKEKKVVVMITTVSIIFIVCNLPSSVLLTARAIEPRLNASGKYSNMNDILASLGTLTENINSAINIVVYYHMSAKYKETLNEMLTRLCCLSCSPPSPGPNNKR